MSSDKPETWKRKIDITYEEYLRARRWNMIKKIWWKINDNHVLTALTELIKSIEEHDNEN
jgi:hypothetical protein